ncbi:MAG: hypothetical protein CMG00_03390 [Candidatus Marinimicrobia bacterium]|nr:hypothetical protein [Candidatus Neomarinimicrobiota bacterium]|tara:strand:+ start:1693 stop:2613 length:921 start_codon:yes stop_codon:yes gene_type:complete
MNLDFSDIKVLLVGDFMIDHYIMGTSNRMSPEANVPVVIPKEEYSIPGGAGNVAMNLSAMGAHVTCLGFIGDDIWGEKLTSILKNQGINTSNLEIIENYNTTLKQRIYANGMQVARLDKEKIIDWNPNVTKRINYNNYDVIILSDYNKGILNDFKIPDTSIPLIVDPKKDDFVNYAGSNIITPNLNELNRASNIDIKDKKSIVDACNELIKIHGFDYIVAKRGSKGMIIVGKDNFIKKINAHIVGSPDVTGAGDTVIATLALAYTITKDIEESAKIANTAAAIAVNKTGTASVTIDEINNYIESNK